MLYKYLRCDNYLIDSLDSRYFWFSKPDKFNDPFDCNMECLRDVTFPSYIVDYCKFMGFNSPVDYFKAKTDEFGVLCFTEAKDGNLGDKGYNNCHFWAHYADSHKGVVLGFDKSMLQSYYSKEIMCNAELKEVEYREKPIDFDKEDIVLETTDYNCLRTKKTAAIFSKVGTDKERDMFFTQLLLSKDSRVWGVENESRIILGGLAIQNLKENKPFNPVEYCIFNDYGYKIPYPEGDVLREVTFGVRFPEESIDCLVNKILSKHENVTFYKAKLNFINADIDREQLIF